MRVLYGLLLILAAAPAAGDWERVLSQIDLPHHYYYREMYLPQYTTGPGSLAWSPDSRELIYSMAGSLWRQPLDSDLAEEITDGPGDDYQPDWSPDGRRVIFVRYDGQAMELHELDLESGKVRQLTDGGAVNVDPRYAPDGKRVAWISTAADGRFRLFVGDIDEDGLRGAALRQARQSRVARYYYSPFDHELSPAWSPDGRELLIVANPEVPYGTGSLFRLSLADPETLHLVQNEETSWRMHPDWAPDGRRIVYSSYFGRQWHQLWATTVDGGPPMPLSFGEFDVTHARFSPDGRFIAAITNEHGNTAIRIQSTGSGPAGLFATGSWRYLGPTGLIEIETTDGRGNRVPARISVLDAAGGAHMPDDALAHAADGFDRRQQRAETRYFHSTGRAAVVVPTGKSRVTVWRGLEYEVAQREIKLAGEGDETTLSIDLRRLDLPARWSEWRSGDLHVHMNYGGTYRMTPARLHAMALAEDLDVVHNLVVNKEQRIPDIHYFTGRPDFASDERVLILHDQEFHTSLWGHLGLLGLHQYLVPDYAAYPYTFAASPWPHNAAVADLAYVQAALVGYVHPYDWLPDPAGEDLANMLPVDAALGKVDYFEVVGFSDHRASAEVWHRLLNCGIRPAAAAGTDAMTNYASLRGPIGMNRVYARAGPPSGDAEADRASWMQAIAAGHTFATNGPLLLFEVEGKGPGEAEAPGRLHYSGIMRSIVPVRHLEIVVNGRVVREVPPGRDRRSADFEGTIDADEGDWILVRAWDDDMAPLVLDIYPYATTNPVFVGPPAANARCEPDYFLNWIDDIESAAAAASGYNDEAERQQILDDIRRARAVWDGMRVND